MSRAVNTSTSGNYCGRAAHRVSGLCSEDMRQIEAHRAKDRPTPWAHLAARYGVNEIDLKQLFQPANDDKPASVAVLAPPKPAPPRNLTAEREAMFRSLWQAGTAKKAIAHALVLSPFQVDRLRVKLGLLKRTEGSKPNAWTAAEDAYILRHYIAGGMPAHVVAESLTNRTPQAIIGRAHRKGWTRAHHPDVRP